MSLKAIQHGFIQQLAGHQSGDAFVKSLIPCGNLSVEQQLAIYQNNMRGVLQKTLAQVYPVCRRILGDRYFKQMAKIYIKNQPSKHYDLNFYGEPFSVFLQRQCLQRTELRELTYLSDLATIEWVYQQMYFAADESRFDFTAFAQLMPQQQAQSIFKLIPCLTLVKSEYPVLSIWKLNQEGREGESNSQQTLKTHSENICVLRKNKKVRMLAIDTQTTNLLTRIIKEESLDVISQAGYGTLLTSFIQQGWIDGFKVKNA